MDQFEDEQASLEPEEKGVHSRGIYLLPNILTTAGLFAGFYAIVAAMRGYFDTAAIAIFVAMLADGLDGRVARLTHTQTEFGAEYDSLADMAAFGIAPALVIYSWSLIKLGKLGWLAAFLYAAATALRLARFNTQAHHDGKLYFQGLPCTLAAGFIAGTVWVGSLYKIGSGSAALPAACLTVLVAGLMVSTIRYHSFKGVDFKGRMPFFTGVIVVVILAAIALDPPEVLFGMFLIYVISGPTMTLWQLRRVRKQRIAEHKNLAKRKED